MSVVTELARPIATAAPLLRAIGISKTYRTPDHLGRLVLEKIEFAMREGDCVLMPQGYHPNVAAPGGSINFLWMMAANREGEDRQFGVVNVQPEYAAKGSGIEAGRAIRDPGGVQADPDRRARDPGLRDAAAHC